jgi:hypothetical protein
MYAMTSPSPCPATSVVSRTDRVRVSIGGTPAADV